MPSTTRPPIPPKAKANRTALSLDTIVAASLMLVRKDGMAGLSMRQLAAELHVTPTALYHHVQGKDELLEHCAERILSEMPRPDPLQPWSVQLRRLILHYQALFLRYPGLARYLLLKRDSSLASLQWVESIVALMLGAGYDVDAAAEVVQSMTFLIDPLTLIDATLPPAKSARAMIARSRVNAAVRQFPGRFPALAQALPAMRKDAYHPHFELALDRVIAGIEHALRERGQSAQAGDVTTAS